ncbi:hypothetical protein LTR15_007962 [Elasticomyces elasticus]|nr:hypothetical protein LTR15_007962 [Elasticomyces elasticus]
MDPLSITASVVGISAACASVVKSLKAIHDKYKQADLYVLAICSESSTVQAALAQIEYLLREDGDALISRFRTQPSLASAFDTAIIGCQMVFSCLDAELQELDASLQRDGSLDWKLKFKTVWKQDTMMALSQQVRGQVLALNTLLQSLQMESMSEVRRLLWSQQAHLKQISDQTASLRKQYPHSLVPDSVFDNQRSAGSIFGGADSVLGAEDFAFDDDIINSKAYRRAMALAQAQYDHAHNHDHTRPGATEFNSAASMNFNTQVLVDEAEPPDVKHEIDTSPPEMLRVEDLRAVASSATGDVEARNKKRFVSVTPDGWNYRLVDVTKVQTARQLRPLVCYELGMLKGPDIEFHITTPGRKEHEEALQDELLMAAVNGWADAGGTLRFLIRYRDEPLLPTDFTATPTEASHSRSSSLMRVGTADTVPIVSAPGWSSRTSKAWRGLLPIAKASSGWRRVKP